MFGKYSKSIPIPVTSVHGNQHKFPPLLRVQMTRMWFHIWKMSQELIKILIICFARCAWSNLDSVLIKQFGYHTRIIAQIKMNSCYGGAGEARLNFTHSVKIVELKSLVGLSVSPLQRPTDVKPSLQNKRQRLKRKQRGAKKKLAHILSFRSGAAVDWVSKWNVSQWENGLSGIHRDLVSPASLSLSLSPSPPTHLSFRSHGSFSLIWIPTVFCITDSASITVKHMPFTTPTVSWCRVCERSCPGFPDHLLTPP